MNINLQPNITGTNVKLVRGAIQSDLTNAVNSSRTYRDESEAFSIVSENKSIVATDSANSAYSSATTASNAANTAITKANEANSSAISASASETVCIAKATIATDKADIATAQAVIATNKAIEANNDADTATTQAGIAITKASEAVTSASNALVSANNADTSEANALTYRNEAESFANSVNPSNIVHISGTETITGNKTFSGIVSGLTKATVGLSNVDNTADSTKSVSYATTAGTASASDVYSWAKAVSKPSYTASEIGLGNVTNESKATMFTSPTFTGTVTLPSTTSIGTISNTELGYLDGVTSAIQTQINSKANNSDVVNITNNQTVAGVKTFTSSPIVPTPTTDLQVATKKYVDDRVQSGTDYYQGAYGISWDYTTDTYIRTGAKGYTAIQSLMRRCVLNANGTVNYYLHPTNSNFKEDGTPSILTGADGNVMVQVPKFYAKIETVGTVDKYSISLTADAGYVVHPWFVKAGVEVPYRYFRAYTGFNSGGTLKSISGVTPTRTQTIATFRSQAIANGTGWHLTDWNAVNAIKLLCYIEFNDYIVTDYIGTGNDTGSDYGLTTGQSNAIGNASSPSTNNNMWMSYRGIENFYADCWEFLDGVNINNYVFYVNQNYTTFASDVFTGDYVSKGTTIAASASYITRCAVSVSGGWIPSVIGGASTTYYGDGFWSSTGAMVALFGGGADYGAFDGAGALGVNAASSVSYADVGGAVCF